MKSIDLKWKNEQIEQRMSLRDGIKAIFKKYGFTTLAILSIIGVVISVLLYQVWKADLVP